LGFLNFVRKGGILHRFSSLFSYLFLTSVFIFPPCGRKIIPPHGGKRKGYDAEIRKPRQGGMIVGKRRNDNSRFQIQIR
jgi:hypothetical protein